MKLNWSIFTPVTLTLLATATLSAEAQETRYDADIYLDALDADGHLSILVDETIQAKSNDEKVVSELKSELKVSETKKTLEAHIEEPKAQVEKTQTEYAKDKDSDKVASADKEAYKSDSKAYAEVAAAPKAKDAKAEAYGGDYGASSSDKGFLSKHTTEIEFTFAILVIVVGLIASERFQRAHENHEHDFEESSSDFEQIRDV